MRFAEYIEEASRTDADLGGDMDDMHHIVGILTELGELADPFKKWIAYRKEKDLVNVKEELGDMMWYIGCLCKKYDFDMEEILDKNIAKLRARYPEKFDTEKAQNRDLNAERKILEGTPVETDRV